MTVASLLWAIAALVAGYLIGGIPFAYIVVRTVTGQDITTRGSGNVGSMNVRRATGSWGWFVVAALADGLKGLVPVALVKMEAGLSALASYGPSFPASRSPLLIAVPTMLLGVVLGHNYSVWMALIEHRFFRSGKGLATGAGALLAYDWRYFVIVVAVAGLVIVTSRYLLAGQVAAALSLPIASLVLRSPDWPFALLVGALVYAAHHRRFVGLLHGHEPRLYINDRMGPRG